MSFLFSFFFALFLYYYFAQLLTPPILSQCATVDWEAAIQMELACALPTSLTPTALCVPARTTTLMEPAQPAIAVLVPPPRLVPAVSAAVIRGLPIASARTVRPAIISRDPAASVCFSHTLSLSLSLSSLPGLTAISCGVACNCSTIGSTNVCNGSDYCTCNPGFTGKLCTSCSSGFYGSSCQSCGCGVGATTGSCNSTGACACNPNFADSKCTICASNYFLNGTQCSGIF